MPLPPLTPPYKGGELIACFLDCRSHPKVIETYFLTVMDSIISNGVLASSTADRQ
jgi:hypothetical protein